MSTFLEIQDAVRVAVIDLPAAVTAAVPRLVREAVKNAERRYNFKYMEASASYTTTPLSDALGTVDRFKEFRDRGPFLRKQYGRAERISVAMTSGDTEEIKMFTVEYPDKPRWIRFTLSDINAATFTLEPYPDTLSDWDDGNYRIVIPYYNYSTALANDGDQNWLTMQADDYLIEKATAEAFKMDWDYDKYALHLQAAEQKYQEVRQTDKKQRLSASGGVWTPHWEGANQGMVNK